MICNTLSTSCDVTVYLFYDKQYFTYFTICHSLRIHNMQHFTYFTIHALHILQYATLLSTFQYVTVYVFYAKQLFNTSRYVIVFVFMICNTSHTLQDTVYKLYERKL